MFKIALASGSLFTIANALAMQSGASSVMSFAQTGAMKEGACCCHAKPCMPTCPEPCGPHTPTPPIPEITVHAPEPVRDVLFNMDMILTRIMHDQHPKPEHEKVPLPPPKSQDEQNFIHEVVSPIVIQMVNNDIIPAIPQCTIPKGTDPEYWGLNEDGIPLDYEMYLGMEQKERQVLPHADEVMRNVLLTTMSDMTLAPGTNLEELVDLTMAAQRETLSGINMTTAEGKKEVEFLLKGMNSVVEEYYHVEPNTPNVLEVIEDLVDIDLEEAGLDTGLFDFDLKDIVKETIDAVEEAAH